MTSKMAADENAFINSDNRKRRSLLQEVPPLGSVQTIQFEIQFDGLELGDRYLQIYYASEKKKTLHLLLDDCPDNPSGWRCD